MFVGDYRRDNGADMVSFLDLVDVLAVSRLREFLPMRTVRQVYTALGEHLGGPHPFGRREFLIDSGGRLLVHKIGELGNHELEEVVTRQGAFPAILIPFLKRIKFDPDTHLANEIDLTDSVFIDPRRRFGKPIVRESCMPTATLYQTYLATGSEHAAADWYGVGVEDVRAAIQFETEFSGLAA